MIKRLCHECSYVVDYSGILQTFIGSRYIHKEIKVHQYTPGINSILVLRKSDLRMREIFSTMYLLKHWYVSVSTFGAYTISLIACLDNYGFILCNGIVLNLHFSNNKSVTKQLYVGIITTGIGRVNRVR